MTEVYYICPDCACVSSEQEMKSAPARWEAQNPDAYARGNRSFWSKYRKPEKTCWLASIRCWRVSLGEP